MIILLSPVCAMSQTNTLHIKNDNTSHPIVQVTSIYFKVVAAFAGYPVIWFHLSKATCVCWPKSSPQFKSFQAEAALGEISQVRRIESVGVRSVPISWLWQRLNMTWVIGSLVDDYIVWWVTVHQSVHLIPWLCGHRTCHLSLSAHRCTINAMQVNNKTTTSH